MVSISPSSAAQATRVTISGSGFGSTQGSGHVSFHELGTKWGAPGNLASFTVVHRRLLVEQLDRLHGPDAFGGGAWAVTAGTPATLMVTNQWGQISNVADLSILSPPPPPPPATESCSSRGCAGGSCWSGIPTPGTWRSTASCSTPGRFRRTCRTTPAGGVSSPISSPIGPPRPATDDARRASRLPPIGHPSEPALTGTPVETRTGDLWSITHLPKGCRSPGEPIANHRAIRSRMPLMDAGTDRLFRQGVTQTRRPAGEADQGRRWERAGIVLR